jgi:hypothetical protein
MDVAYCCFAFLFYSLDTPLPPIFGLKCYVIQPMKLEIRYIQCIPKSITDFHRTVTQGFERSE